MTRGPAIWHGTNHPPALRAEQCSSCGSKRKEVYQLWMLDAPGFHRAGVASPTHDGVVKCGGKHADPAREPQAPPPST